MSKENNCSSKSESVFASPIKTIIRKNNFMASGLSVGLDPNEKMRRNRRFKLFIKNAMLSHQDPYEAFT